jgi:rhodanese-related sulfurtransferase
MNYKNLGPADFKKEIEATENAVVLDVRTPAEIAAGKIDGAIELDFFAADFANKILELDKSKTYFVYCRSGNRSGQACAFMAQNGFPTPVNLQGGMGAWEATMA